LPLHKIIFNCKHLCTKEQVKEIVDKAFKDNNEIRDLNLDEKLQHLKMDIFEKVDTSIDKRIKHLSMSPETSGNINKINVLCATRGEQIISMKDDITEIKNNVENILAKIDKGLSEKADKESFVFWRNFLVSGMFLAIFLGVIGLVLNVIFDK